MSFTESDIVSKVEKLLAQANSTQFKEEADAFMAKAQELMTAYQIDEAVLAARKGKNERVAPICVRIPIVTPFRNSKAMLLSYVAGANDCKVVFHSAHSGERGYAAVSVVGMPNDVEFVKMLYASLILQLTGELLRTPVEGVYFDYDAYKEKKVHGKTFRKNFIDAFAQAVGTRLNRARAEARKAAKEAAGETDVAQEASSVALALMDKSEQVSSAYKSFFPKLGTAKFSTGTKNRSGASQGAAAGARANLSGKSVNSQRSIGR